MSEAEAHEFSKWWLDAMASSETSKWAATWTPMSEFIESRNGVVARLTTDVVTKRLERTQREETSLEFAADPQSVPLPGGTFLRVPLKSTGETVHPLAGTWDLLVRNVEGTARVESLFQRPTRVRSESAPERHLGSAVVQGGLLLQAHPENLHERGFRTLIDPTGVVELWVDEAKLPLEWRQLKGKSFTVTDQSGVTCNAEVQGFRYYSRSRVSGWLEAGWREQIESKASAREAGQVAWQLGERGGTVLVAKFSPADIEPCPDPRFARMVETPPLTSYPPLPEDELAVQNATREFQAVLDENKIQAQAQEAGLPSNLLDEQYLTVQSFSDGSREFVVATIKVGERCSQLSFGTFAIWEVKQESWVLLTSPDQATYPFLPRVVADVNNDGSPEFYGDDLVVRELGGTFQVAEDTRPVNFQNGCDE